MNIAFSACKCVIPNNYSTGSTAFEWNHKTREEGLHDKMTWFNDQIIATCHSELFPFRWSNAFRVFRYK